MNEETNAVRGEKVTENITLCPDGVYRWAYEYKMLKNPTIMFTVWKVLGIACAIVAAIGLLFALFNGDIADKDYMLGFLKLILVALGVVLVLGVIGYLVLAAVYGGKYQVLFEMTDKYVKHIQMPKQFKKAEALSWLTAFAGAAAGSPTAAGAGLLSTARSSMTTELKNVAALRIRKNRSTIHVDQKLDKNQVYAEDADFDFVAEFLKEHCKNAKITG